MDIKNASSSARPADPVQREAPTNEFSELLARACQGSDEAAWDLVETYGPHVLRTIRRSLNRDIQSKFDSEDFAQVVWASFFRAPERLEGVTQPKQLVGLLAKMARNKVIDEMRRRLQTQKYSVRQEESVSSWDEHPIPLASREPTPSQFAVARERWMHLLNAQPDHYRHVITLKLMGRSNRSIAKQLDVCEKTVKRVLDRLMESSDDEPHIP